MSEKRIEDVIRDTLKGDLQKNAIDFNEYLKVNELTANGAEISYKGEVMCYMHLDSADDYPNPWIIWTEGDYSHETEDVFMDEQMKEIAWAHVNICKSCGADCSPGKRKMIFGKEFDNVCSADMAFYIPNAEELDCLKKLLDMRKNDILRNI